MDLRTTARARVTVTLEVEAEGLWGSDCALGQLRKQASENVVSRLTRLFHGMGGVRVIGTEVSAIVTEDKP